MSEDVYAKPDLARKVRFQASSEDNNVEAQQNISDVTIYDNYLPEQSSTSTSRENLTEERQPSTTSSVSKGCEQTALKVAALLLLVLALAAVIILATLWTLDRNNRAERETFSSQLKNVSGKLTAQTRLVDELRGNLTQKMHQLEEDRDTLTAMTDNLTSEVENLRDEIEDRDTRQCPADWIHFGRSCYFISNSSKTWRESKEACERLQANLVIVSNVLEQMFLNCFEIQTWIGLNLTGPSIKTDWMWVNGSKLADGESNQYWGKHEPSKIEEKCGQIKTFDSLKSWNNADCNTTFRYICEKILIH